MSPVSKIEEVLFFIHVRAFTHVFLAILKLRTAWPSIFIKHTLIRFGKNFPKFTKLYGIDHWPAFKNILDNDLIKLWCAVAMLMRHLYIKNTSCFFQVK